MERQNFPWAWLSVSLLLIVGTPAVYIWIVLPNAEPDGLADVGGFFLGIALMSVGFISLLTLVVWVVRKRSLRQERSLELNFSKRIGNDNCT